MLQDVEIERSTTVDRVVEALRDAVLRGDVEPGTALREVALARTLSVARSTVREALQILAQERLVSRIPGRGVVVARLDEDGVGDVYRVRRVLELAATRAIASASDSELAGVRRANDRFAQVADADDPEERTRLHLEAHVALVALLGSARLVETYTSALAELRLALATTGRVLGGGGTQRREHARLGRLVETRDVPATLALMERHLDQGEREVMATLRQTGQISGA